MTETSLGNTLGVDTHRDTNVAAVLDELGRVVDTAVFPTSTAGDRALVDWAESFGPVHKAGIEGTGSFGASLSRYLTVQSIECVEVNRPNRQHRRRHGKSDVADAIGAARAVLSGEADGRPRGNNGLADALRANRVALRSAKRARTQAINQLHSLRVNAPAELKLKLDKLSTVRLVSTVAALRPGHDLSPLTATKQAMKSIGRRVWHLEEEIVELEAARQRIVDHTAPVELTNELGVGPAVAADLLIALGDDYQRIRSEAAFASLCGVSPVDLSSGLHTKHRLNQSGDRQANCALHRIVITRMVYDTRTQDFIAKTIARGKTKRDAIRILKRHIARHIWRLLQQHPPQLATP